MGGVRSPIRLRTESDQIAYGVGAGGVRSRCVSLTSFDTLMHAYILF